MEFKQYRKTALTVARPLTEADYDCFDGVIQTLEGPKPFGPGDYLARDAKGQWPIKYATIIHDYKQVSAIDAGGWASYQPLDVRLACQMTEAFTVGNLQGKPGDYLVRSGENEWPVDRDIFESSYTFVE